MTHRSNLHTAPASPSNRSSVRRLPRSRALQRRSARAATVALLISALALPVMAAPRCQPALNPDDIIGVGAEHAFFQIRGERLDVRTTDRGKAVVSGRFYVRPQNGGCLRDVAVRNVGQGGASEWQRILLDDNPGCSDKLDGWGRLNDQVATVGVSDVNRRVIELRLDTGRAVYFPKIELAERAGRWRISELCM